MRKDCVIADHSQEGAYSYRSAYFVPEPEIGRMSTLNTTSGMQCTVLYYCVMLLGDILFPSLKRTPRDTSLGRNILLKTRICTPSTRWTVATNGGTLCVTMPSGVTRARMVVLLNVHSRLLICPTGALRQPILGADGPRRVIIASLEDDEIN